MASNVDKIAYLLGAKIVASIPEVGPGLLGASRIAKIVASLRSASSTDAKLDCSSNDSMDPQQPTR